MLGEPGLSRLGEIPGLSATGAAAILAETGDPRRYDTAPPRWSSWDGGHLYVFTIGKKQYGDPFFNLEGTGDERAVRVGDAVAPGGTIAYTYDFGADWEHEIKLEEIIPREHSRQYPVCVAFRGDSPVEYWNEEEPEEPTPFGLKKVNRRLAALGRGRK